MPNRTDPYPGYSFLVTLTSALGVPSMLGGFSQTLGLRSGLGTVTLERGIVDSGVLWQWILQARIAPANAGQAVLITQRGQSGQAMMSFELANATPASYSGPALQGKGSGDVALQELVLTVGSVEMIAPRTVVYGAQWSRMGKR